MPKKKTLAAQMNEIANKKSKAALGKVEDWYKSCLWHMKEEAKTRKRTATFEAHSVDQSHYHGSLDDFEEEFGKAAEALKQRLEADGSVKMNFRFHETEELTIDGGMEQSWRDVRTFPAAYKLTVTLSW